MQFYGVTIYIFLSLWAIPNKQKKCVISDTTSYITFYITSRFYKKNIISRHVTAFSDVYIFAFGCHQLSSNTRTHTHTIGLTIAKQPANSN